MKFKSKKDSLEDLKSIMQDAIEFKSEEEENDLDNELIHLNFMHIIESIMKEKNMNKKDLADNLKISQSYITQLFTAEKFINIKTLGKIQRLFNVKFDIDYKSYDSVKFEPLDTSIIPSLKVVYTKPIFDPENELDYILENEQESVIHRQG